MFPGRIWAALGSGEASNEHITGDPWPPRRSATPGCGSASRSSVGSSLARRSPTRDSSTVDRARLWSLPDAAPHLVGPAVSVTTAGEVAAWADGLITVNQPLDKLRQMIDAYRDAGGRGPLRLQVHLSWDLSMQRAEAIAHDQWRTNTFSPPACWDIEMVETFDIAGERITVEQVKQVVLVSDDPTGTPLGSTSSSSSGSTSCSCTMSARSSRPSRRRSRIGAPAAAGLTTSYPEARMRISDTADLWWKTAVVYCLDVETFLDWDGDGMGDFVGLAERIDYLAELGVTCLWLMPFYPTANRDDGYDITDFYGVDPRLGTHGDLVELVRTARDRGMRVIVDLVVNHTSDKHPWFRAARSSKGSPYRDFYVWRAEAPETGHLRPGGLPRPGGQHLAAGRAHRRVLPAPVLQAPARPQRGQPAGARRDREGDGLLARARHLRLPGRRRAVPSRPGRGHGQPEGASSPTRTTTWSRCVRSSAGAPATASCSAR